MFAAQIEVKALLALVAPSEPAFLSSSAGASGLSHALGETRSLVPGSGRNEGASKGTCPHGPDRDTESDPCHPHLEGFACEIDL